MAQHYGGLLAGELQALAQAVLAAVPSQDADNFPPTAPVLQEALPAARVPAVGGFLTAARRPPATPGGARPGIRVETVETSRASRRPRRFTVTTADGRAFEAPLAAVAALDRRGCRDLGRIFL
jgi:hypothetical protein